MSLQILEDTDENESIIERYLKGEKPTSIAKATGVQRKDVLAVINHWREVVRDDNASRDVARDALNKMVEHFDHLIKKLYETLEELNNLDQTHQVISQKISALRSVADLESKRVDAMQKAGMLDNSDLGDELADMEKQKEIILDILRNDLCSKCRPHVMTRIGEMTGKIEVIQVHDD